MGEAFTTLVIGILLSPVPWRALFHGEPQKSSSSFVLQHFYTPNITSLGISCLRKILQVPSRSSSGLILFPPVKSGTRVRTPYAAHPSPSRDCSFKGPLPGNDVCVPAV